MPLLKWAVGFISCLVYGESSRDEDGATPGRGQASSLSLAVGCVVAATLLILAQLLLQVLRTDIMGAEADRLQHRLSVL